ncbi:hypothetical protein FRY74_03535 [Vicingus serpentipes]|uniref:Class I SAM-dependent methyltransferase n=1 Tax=Vicingus serpentipes TaxID=1926625 RepID=A0A5C6S098_9FLAO|nr:class I SAM-dependent methyltransferase [Vicingus serpentipes]TXB67270.1 hypothetical protein FRY74_03535 [Vicingus serpentipes]
MKNNSRLENMYLETHNQMIAKNGFTPKALWGSKQSQEKRFEALSKLFLNKEGFTVLDLGCGLCHFNDYLIKNGFSSINYIGADINKNFIDEVRKTKKGIQLINGGVKQILKELECSVDYIVASGIYNLGNNTNETQKTFVEDFTSLYSIINIGFGVNFLSSESNNKDEISVYHEPTDLFKICNSFFTKRIVLSHDYLPHDFTILAFK